LTPDVIASAKLAVDTPVEQHELAHPVLHRLHWLWLRSISLNHRRPFPGPWTAGLTMTHTLRVHVMGIRSPACRTGPVLAASAALRWLCSVQIDTPGPRHTRSRAAEELDSFAAARPTRQSSAFGVLGGTSAAGAPPLMV